MARRRTELTRLRNVIWKLAVGVSAVIAVVSVLAAVDGFIIPIPPFDFGEELDDGLPVAPLLGSAPFAITGLLALVCAWRTVSTRRWPWY